MRERIKKYLQLNVIAFIVLLSICFYMIIDFASVPTLAGNAFACGTRECLCFCRSSQGGCNCTVRRHRSCKCTCNGGVWDECYL